MKKNPTLVIKAVQEIYPNIKGGFVYWETKQDGSTWENPIDGLVWENTEFAKPTWEQIEPLLNDVELNAMKQTRIQEVKIKRDIFLEQNITVSTGTYKATTSAKSLFFNAVNGRTATQYPMPWRLADDITWVSLTKGEAYELYDALEAREASGYQQETVYLLQIRDALTVEQLEAININFE